VVEAPKRSEIDLLVDAAHELRSPLNSLQGYGELIARGEVAQHELQTIGESICRQAERLNQTVNDILELAALDAHGLGKIRLDQSSVEAILSDCVDALGDERSERLVVLLPNEPLPEVQLDRRRIVRVLLNVIDNALKYSARSSPVLVHVFLTPRFPPTPRDLVIEIEDQGIGMDSETRAKAFTRFHRSPRVAEIPGTGLGLAIAQEIVRLHQGSISISSRETKGTTVTIRLPAEVKAGSKRHSPDSIETQLPP
jgi:signal transduction histidine kinase